MAPCSELFPWEEAPGVLLLTAARSGLRTQIATQLRRCRSAGHLQRRLHVMSKATRLTLLAPLAFAWLSGSALAQGGVTNSTKNPNQVAILHWYPANLTTSFRVGQVPTGVAFDGANIWVTDLLGQTVTKLQASDGAVLDTFAANRPAGIIYDGANIWISGSTLSKVRASDGAVLGQFHVPGTGGNFLALDGANL